MKIGLGLGLEKDRKGQGGGGGGVSAPVNTVAPVVSGTTTENETLSVTNGTWTNSPTSYTYQWRRNGATILGETASTFLLTSSDVSALIDCVVTATNAGGSTSANSNSVGPIDAAADPNTILVNFGEKTRRGHGGYDLGEAATITSGNTGSVWTVDARNHLVLAGTAGTAPPALASSYTLGLSNGKTAEVTILPNAAHVAPASDAATTVNNFQPKSLDGVLVHGDTMYCRAGDYNPAGLFRPVFGASVAPGAFTGSNYIEIRPDGDAHSANFFRVYMKPNGQVGAQYRLTDMDFSQKTAPSVAPGTHLAFVHGTSTAVGSHFTHGPVLVNPKVFGVEGAANGSTSTAGLYDYTGTDTVKAMQIIGGEIAWIGAKATTLNKNPTVDGVHFHDTWDDNVYVGQQNGAIIKNCLFHTPRYTSGAHADHIQFDQSGVTAGTYPGPVVQNNVMIYGNSTSAALKQGIFMSNNAAGVFYTGTDISNNLLVHGEVNALNVSGLDGGGYTRNTVVTERLDNTSIALTKVTNSQNASVTNNIGDSFSDITPTGTNTFSDNLDLDPALASGAGSHAATFVNPLYGNNVDTSSDDLDTIIAIARAAWAPIENGPAKKGDGTYMGALFPDGTLNDGSVY